MMDNTAKKYEWHRKFAWVPTQITDKKTVWLKFYERRLARIFIGYEYWYHRMPGETIEPSGVEEMRV